MNSDTDSSLLFRHRARSVRRAPLREFVAEVETRVTRGRGFTCLVTDDRELRELNRRFRHKDYATDVLSFPCGADLAAAAGVLAGVNGSAFEERRAETRRQAESLPHIGEIAISLDRARAQAREHGHSLHDELRILVLHGALHLSGLDHESDGGRMARAERRWRKHFGLPVGLIERSEA